MGFTRSTTTTNVHSTLGDYPSVDDGLTPEQLKARFDAPATGLKGDINTLETELEATTAAANLGAGEMFTGDTSGENIQAKLAKLHDEIEAAALGEIPDNTITEAKLTSSYSSTLAKKNGQVQTGLNSEKLGGKTLATIESERTAAINAAKTEIISRQSPADTEYTIALTTSYTTYTKTFTAKSRFMLLTAETSNSKAMAIVDCRKNNFTFVNTNRGGTLRIDTKTTEFLINATGGYEVRFRNISYSNQVLTMDIYGRRSSDTTDSVTVTCMALDGLLP